MMKLSYIIVVGLIHCCCKYGMIGTLERKNSLINVIVIYYEYIIVVGLIHCCCEYYGMSIGAIHHSKKWD